MNYDADDSIFNGYTYQSISFKFNKINRSEYGKGTNYNQNFHEVFVGKRYTPTSGYRFIECNKFLTGENQKIFFQILSRMKKDVVIL